MSDELVKILEVYGEIEAQLIRSVLESQGIECLFQGESLRLTHPMPSHPLNRVRIFVRAEDAEDAQAILAASEDFTECPTCGQLYSSRQDHCPHCRSSR